ncbi:MAG TPA: NCS2 family permease [Kiritimatiellia bacterium]|nr:NCS2 family permease [Kiritimatiellia bacterium]
MPKLDNFFKLAENNTNVRTEVIAGLTTFVTMAYIIFVNPAVLGTDFSGKPTGLDPQAVMLATSISTALATLIMGLFARYPIAQAPGMGNNHLFVSVVMGLSAIGISNAWQVALGLVFLSGLSFLILSLFQVRQTILRALSPSMRSGIAAGIGLFITFIGLRNGGIIVEKPGTLVGLNVNITSVGPMIFTFGLLVIGILHAYRIPGSILIGMLFSSVLAIAMGQVVPPGMWIGLPDIQSPAVFQLDIAGALTIACIPFIVMFLFTDLFDTVGTLTGVSERAGFMKNGELPRAGRALVSDAVGTMAGAMLGTSTVTSYIESASGVEQGGRTGLVCVVVAAMFLLSIVFAPLIAMVASFPPITASALVIVGVFMAGSIRNVDWDDITESLPAFMIMVGIPLTYSIADGLALGLVGYPVLKIASGRLRDVKWPMYIMAIAMAAYFILVRARIG